MVHVPRWAFKLTSGFFFLTCLAAALTICVGFAGVAIIVSQQSAIKTGQERNAARVADLIKKLEAYEKK
jgi:hypothetical protein